MSTTVCQAAGLFLPRARVFYDLNWDPLVGSPGADPVGAAARATEILDGLAPAAEESGPFPVEGDVPSR